MRRPRARDVGTDPPSRAARLEASMAAYYVELAGATGSGSTCPRAASPAAAIAIARRAFQPVGYERLVVCTPLELEASR